MDEIDPQGSGLGEAPEGEQPVAEGIAPEAPEGQGAEEPSLLDAIRGAVEGDEPQATGDDRPRGPDGRFLKKDGTPEDAPADPAAPEAKAEKPPEKPAEDLYKEPEGLKEGARERFQQLVAVAREREAELAQVREQFAQQAQVTQAFQQMLVETGASDQEFGALLDFAKAVKQGDWNAAEPLLAHLAQQFRVATGRDPAGSDPFAQHTDLSQAVQAGQITREAAIQVMQARQVLAQQQRQQAEAQQRQQQEHGYVQSVRQATGQVSQMVQQWSQRDLDWPRKQSLMQAHAKQIAETLPPDQWGFALKLAYDTITQTMAAQAPQRPPVGPGTPQPLRPSGAQGGRREPSNMQEAIQAALGGGEG
jgi:hypothetical protein